MNKHGWKYKKLGEISDIYQPKTLSSRHHPRCHHTTVGIKDLDLQNKKDRMAWSFFTFKP